MSNDPLGDSIAQEEARLQALRTAIGLYKFTLGHFPSTLEDLSFNKRDIPNWESAFIRWHGPATFVDSFGHAYQYSCDASGCVLISPGLDAAVVAQQEC